MVELAIEDRVIPKEMYNESAVKSFIEKQLLPAINTQAIDKAHNMFYALQSIYQVEELILFICLFLLFFHYLYPYLCHLLCCR